MYNIYGTGVVIGLVLFGLSVWLNLKVMKNASEMPPREAAKHIVIRYMGRIAVLTLLLGLLTWLKGLHLIIGILGGMVLGSLVFLVVSRGNRAFFERLVNRPGGRC
ncbi:MAG: hypothetical protein ACOX4Q_14600 [Syntrophomonadales bacterium]|jgi:uncharacterized iron-regulated membrane protein